MDFAALMPVLVPVITSIIGPLVVFFVSRGYTDRKIQRSSQKLIEKIEEEIGDHEFALKKLNETLIDYLEERVKSAKSVKLELKLIAVAMTFSWDFILEKLPDILDREEFSAVSINLSVCFVDCMHLADPGLKISKEGRKWAKISKERERDIREYRNTMERFGSRFTCDFRTFANLPHWHGWLVTEQSSESDTKSSVDEEIITHLFLGRTKWEHNYPKTNKKRPLPKLTVGQNEYRLYTDQTEQGRRRISLFEGWHTYYFERVYKKKL